MTDTSKREELIGAVTDALVDDAWEGHDGELTRGDLRVMALRAVQVFEQAHTPTDDERTPYLPADLYNRLQMYLLGSGNREALLLAGEVQSLTGASALRRRTAVQEPSAAPTVRDHVRSLTGATDAELDELGGFQGEPSDADVEAFRREWWAAHDEGDDYNKVRRGLRAAYKTRGEGR